MALLARLRAVFARFENPSAWPPVRRDWLVWAGWLIFGALDIGFENANGVSLTDPDPTPLLTWVVLVPYVSVLLLRRSSPLEALVLGYGIACSAAVLGAHLDKGFVPVTQLGFLAFCAARVARDRRDVVTVVAVSLAGVLAALLTFSGSQSVAGFFWAAVMIVGLPIAAARAFGQHARLHALLEERAAQLEVQRDERARLAAARERERIAGELHDVVAHGVSAMVVQASAARRLVARHGDSEAAREAIAQAEVSGRAALDELRRLLGVLRRGDEAIALAPQPSLARVDRLVARLRDEGVPVRLAVEGEPAPLSPGLDVTAYRIVEDALGDVLRGDATAAVQVHVRYGARTLELEVVGAGGGPAAESSEERFGLRERVALFGGELVTGRRRGGAWALRARLPLERVAA